MDPKNLSVEELSALNAATVHKELKVHNGIFGESSKLSKHEQPIMVHLHIQDHSSKKSPIPFFVTPSMSLWNLKGKVEKEYGYDKKYQRWILGDSFATDDEVSLSSYGVVSECPIVLMTFESSKSLTKHSIKRERSSVYDDVVPSTSKSSRDTAASLSPDTKRQKKICKSEPEDVKPVIIKKENFLPNESFTRPDLNQDSSAASHSAEGKEYRELVQLGYLNLVTNLDTFECPICFADTDPSDGVVLQECLHSFCKVCLSRVVELSETVTIQCPFRSDDSACEFFLLEREIKSLVTAEVFERHLQRSVSSAENQAQNSFHCKTPDCPGWCFFEDNVNTFLCPVCQHTNCLNCQANHEGYNCKQYQEELSDNSEESNKSKTYLEEMVQNGQARKCPKCSVIIIKNGGCNHMLCSMCNTPFVWTGTLNQPPVRTRAARGRQRRRRASMITWSAIDDQMRNLLQLQNIMGHDNVPYL